MPPQPGLELQAVLSLPGTWSLFLPPPDPVCLPVTHSSASHGQGLPGRQMAREPGKRSLSLQDIVEHSKVVKETARRKRSGPNNLMPMKKSEENRRMKN